MMNCPNCNAPLIDGAAFCGSCGSAVAPAPQAAAPVQPVVSPEQNIVQQPQAFQQNAGAPQQYQQQAQYVPPVQYQQPPYQQTVGVPPQNGGVVPPDSKSKIAAGLLAIFLGTLGIHKFYLGYTKAGIIMLLVSLLTFGIGLMVMAVIALIEGIMYLTKSDWDFYNIYVVGEKQWF